uniref:GTP-binding protein n=1 Tax=Panagrellus redivivus TaxID=6233 RepID=A0A7E4V3S8_PANRE
MPSPTQPSQLVLLPVHSLRPKKQAKLKMIHAGHRSRQKAPDGKLQRSCSQMRPQQRPRTAKKGLSALAITTVSPAPQNPPSTNGTTSQNGKDIAPHELTLIVMGGEKVGKTALVSQFLWDTFVDEYHATVEEFNWIEYETGVGGDSLMLQVIDTAGSRDFIAMRALYTKQGDAFMVVFAWDDPLSFDEAKRIIAEIRENNTKNAPIMLIANKSDLTIIDEKGVKEEDISDFVMETGLKYVNVSAKDGTRVNKLFGDVIGSLKVTGLPSISQQLRKRRQSMPTRRAYSGLDDFDVKALERIAKHSKRNENCIIS